jgi:endonuclease YncB( thermonuclease family)
MAKKVKKILTARDLKKKGVPGVLIPGLLAAGIIGYGLFNLYKVKDYYELKELFPTSATVIQVEDGDTMILKNGLSLRLIGINAPERGAKKYTEAKNELSKEVLNKKVYLEYDRYQDDKFSRVLAWVWIDCETTPQFLPADYMHKSDNESNPGLTENPKGCKKGKLVNEEMVKKGFAEPVVYKDRGESKYQKRLQFMLDLQSSQK